MSEEESDQKKKKKPYESTTNAPIKKTSDLIKLKLDKLMQNPEKPVIIPERPKGKNAPSVPDFVRNVMGSSAGAGSGEFHVYRHLRRKEYSRMKYIQAKSEAELLDEAYHKKIEENLKKAQSATAKKRAKRLKKKAMLKNKKVKTEKSDESKAESESSTEDSENEDEKSVEAKSETNT